MTIPNIKKWLDDILTIFSNATEYVTKGLSMINTDHSAIHKGEAYICPIWVGTLTYGSTLKMLFKSPSVKYPHIKGFEISCKGATIKAQVVLNANVTNNGSEVSNPFIQLNHNSSNESGSKLYSNPTYTGGENGDFLIAHGSTGVTKAQGSATFTNKEFFEYVLENDETDYILILENIDIDENDANEIYVRLFFYEEDYGITLEE